MVISRCSISMESRRVRFKSPPERPGQSKATETGSKDRIRKTVSCPAGRARCAWGGPIVTCDRFAQFSRWSAGNLVLLPAKKQFNRDKSLTYMPMRWRLLYCSHPAGANRDGCATVGYENSYATGPGSLPSSTPQSNINFRSIEGCHSSHGTCLLLTNTA